MSTKKRPEIRDAVASLGAMGPNQAAVHHESHAGYIEIRAFAGEILALQDEDASKKEPRG